MFFSQYKILVVVHYKPYISGDDRDQEASWLSRYPGHTAVNAASFWHLLGSRVADQSGNGTHVLIAFHATSTTNSHRIQHSVAIVLGCPEHDSAQGHRDCIFLFANDACGIHGGENDQSVLHVSHSSTSCIHGVMISIQIFEQRSYYAD